MKAFTYLVPALAAIASAGKIDQCAGNCISKAISATGCSSSDSLCICSSNLFLETIEGCGPCGEDNSNPAVALAQNYCESVSLSKRSDKFDGHSYSWWQKEWRKVRASHAQSDHDGHSPSSYDPSNQHEGHAPGSYDPKPAEPQPYHAAPQPYHTTTQDPKPYEPTPSPYKPTETAKSEHPVEDWFTAHPNYLINHPGWLINHPGWAEKHADFLREHLPKDHPCYPGENKPTGYTSKPSTPTGYTKDPSQPTGYPGKPDPTGYPSKPEPTGYPHPQPPPQPHKPYPGKPTTTTCTSNKPSPTVW